MKYCFDKLEYRNQRVCCSGWAAGEKPDHAVSITLYDHQGIEIKGNFSFHKRPDVGLALFGTDQYDSFGFTFEAAPVDQGDWKLLFSAGEEDNETAVIPVRQLVRTWKKKHSAPEVMKRFLRASDKKAFWREEKYLDFDEKDRDYALWKDSVMPDKKAMKAQTLAEFEEKPVFHFVVPVYKPNPLHLLQMVNSVRKQTWSKWQLHFAYAGSKEDETGTFLAKCSEKDSRIQVCFLEENLGISGNTNAALETVKDSWICFMDQDDLLREDALYEYARRINLEDPDIIYCDEDKYDDEKGIYFEPHFKSDFNPELLCCNNYICHMLAVKKSIVDQVGFLDPGMDGAQDHDFILRCMDYTDRFCHISKVLYSWRCHRASTAMDPSSKKYAYEAGEKAINAYYKRRGISAAASAMDLPGWYKTTFHIENKPLISVIIPNKDHTDELTRCIHSLEKAGWPNLEILIVENNSEDPETFSCYRELQKEDDRIRILTWEQEFNYSAINNFAAEHAKGEYLLLLNNDTELIDEAAIESMLGYAQKPENGAVGARLFYEDLTVQHAGVLVGVSEGADHVFLHAKKEDPGYMGRAIVSQNLSAVTAACLMISRDKFFEVKGLDPAFKIAYNDVDFCLKLGEKGYRNVYDAFACWYHYESKSRGYEETEEKQKRFDQEKKLLRERWPKLRGGDPYYNRNCSLKHGYYQI